MTDLEIIRAACVKANPEIEIDEWFVCPIHGRIDSPIGHSTGCRENVHTEPEYRPIRLADVLLAVRETNQSWYVRNDGVFFEWEKFTDGGDGHHGVKSSYIVWNLRTDDLEQQSPETLAFLANLLK